MADAVDVSEEVAEPEVAPKPWIVRILSEPMWVLGLVSGASMGLWVHILLLFALVSLVLAVARRGRVA